MEAIDVATQPGRAQLGVRRRRQTLLPAPGPEAGGAVAQAAARARLQRPRRRRAAGERNRAGQHGPPGRRLQRQCATMPGRRRQARRERVELIMQPLPERLERQQQLTAMRNGRQHRLNPSRGGRPAGTLAGQPDQRRAVTIVGLEPAGSQLRPGGLRL